METRFSSGVSGKIITPTGPNICRICLLNGGPVGSDGDNAKGMESIFTTVGEYEDRSLYGIMMTVCAPLGKKEVLKGMPDRICRSCKWRLLSAYELYDICLRSDEKIRGVMESKKQLLSQKNPDQISVKQEIIDPDDQDYNHDDTGGLENSSYMMGDHYFPTAESTLMSDNPTELLEEMQTTVDPNETLFEANYKFDDNGNHCCLICGQEFVYKSQCRSHIIVKHDPMKPFKCDVCHYTLTTELRLIRHKAMTHGEEELLEPAIKEEKDDPVDSIYTCKICSKTFTSIVRFKRHKNVHVVYNRPFKCDICLYRFPNRAQLNQHVKLHQEKSGDADGGSEQSEWKCDYCDEKLPGKRAHTMHVRRFHPQELQNEAKEKNDYKCIICSEAFARESVLNTHMKMHELLAFEKDKEQRQELELLVKKELKAQLPKGSEGSSSVGTSESLGGTLLNSTGSKKKSDADVCFVCMICEHEFEERELLLKHQKLLHSELQLNIVSGGQEDNAATTEGTNDADDNPTALDKDDESTSDTAKNADEDDSMVVDVDPIQLLQQSENGQPKRPGASAIPKCNICQKTFMYNCLLQSHIKKSHSETKPFECKKCHMRFGYRGTLQKHELTHSAQSIRSGDHGSIMYKCKICSAKFLELKLLTFHLRSHRNLTIPAEYTIPKKIEIFQCNFCPQIFNVKEEFDEHLSRDHRQNIPPQQQSTPVQPQQHHNHHARKNPDPRKRLAERQPMNEKEIFFDKLSIVKLEHPAKPVSMETI
ncbi:PR domain zinc finger protein 5-like [Toxorhynchites rutilus septentrionalis]|uniref:PR domain zinc finger protein 5-like n=1 Tax=Toxorhynchites rutilus septentrionalis TaxID=329112 RepID=UPI0024795B9A|nr:PR domain zinc finger protein 5-like [Toxorhynchites rutilus septentrionalis]